MTVISARDLLGQGGRQAVGQTREPDGGAARRLEGGAGVSAPAREFKTILRIKDAVPAPHSD